MKKLVVTLFVFCLFVLSTAEAQIQTPSASPAGKLEQRVGLTDISIEYNRPSKKGRELFVEVEKWGRMWRTGANGATKISFSDDVKVGGEAIKKGTYALYSIPGKEEFTLMLYSDLKLGGNVNGYKKENEVARFKVKTQTMPVEMETMTFVIGDVKPESATVALWWGAYYVPIKVEVSFHDRVMKAIASTMDGPSSRQYYQAASYYYNADTELEQALVWAKKANEMSKRYWQLRLQAQLMAKLGDRKGAKAVLAESTAMATEAGNTGYAEGNAQVLASWKKKKKK